MMYIPIFVMLVIIAILQAGQLYVAWRYRKGSTFGVGPAPASSGASIVPEGLTEELREMGLELKQGRTGTDADARDQAEVANAILFGNG